MSGSVVLLLEQALRNAAILMDDVTTLAAHTTSGMAGKMLALSDDVIGIAKPAVQKAAGVTVDDAAVGANTVHEGGIQQHRETPVLAKVATASMVNKTILGTVFIALSGVAPVVPQIMLGLGALYLSYEGAHKVAHGATHAAVHAWRQLRGRDGHGVQVEADAPEEPSAFDKMIDRWYMDKGTRGSVARWLGHDKGERTAVINMATIDAILSSEIMLVALGSFGNESLGLKTAALAAVAVATTLGVYGSIWGIARSDNLADWLTKKSPNGLGAWVGEIINKIRPPAMNLISKIGTLAMLGVGGEILVHLLPAALHGMAMPAAADAVHHAVTALTASLPHLGGEYATSVISGMVAGLGVTVTVAAASRIARAVTKAIA